MYQKIIKLYQKSIKKFKPKAEKLPDGSFSAFVDL